MSSPSHTPLPLHDDLLVAEGGQVRLVTAGGIFDGTLEVHPVRGQISLGIATLALRYYTSPADLAVSGKRLTLAPQAVLGVAALPEPVYHDADRFI